MTKKVIVFIVAFAAVVVLGYFTFSRFEQAKHIDAAYQEAKKSIDAHATELEQWYLNHCNGATKKTAESLTGWGMKWVTVKTFGNKDEMRKASEEIIRRELFSEEDCKQAFQEVWGKVALDCVNIEDELATKTKCYNLSSEAKKAEADKTNPIPNSGDAIRMQEIGALQAAVLSFVGGEVAAQMAVRMATSAGILGTGAALSWETFGIGLGVGVIVDVVVGWFMNPSAEIQTSLDECVHKAAAEQKKHFTEAAIKALDARRSEWEKQIF